MIVLPGRTVLIRVKRDNINRARHPGSEAAVGLGGIHGAAVLVLVDVVASIDKARKTSELSVNGLSDDTFFGRAAGLVACEVAASDTQLHNIIYS